MMRHWHLSPLSGGLLALLLLLPLAALAADSPANSARSFVPARAGFSPTVDPVLPYAEGRLLVKFTREGMQRSRLAAAAEKGAAIPDATTGLASVDAVGREVGLVRISRAHAAPRNRALADRIGAERWFLIEIEGTGAAAAAARYAAQPEVEAATVDWRAFPAAVPGDPLYADHWGHNNTGQLLSYDWATYSHENGDPVGTPGFDANAEAAWDAGQGYGSAGVVIAIIDSGVDIDHPDLDVGPGYDFGSNDSNPDDDSADPGHGTCCAGVAAALVDNGRGACGIAAGCTIMPCKVADNQGTMYFSYLQNALYWAADNGADVISMSLGAPITSDPATDDALEYAYGAGVVILAATGNENDNAIHYPAIHALVIGVGAASPCGERKRSSSSVLEVNPGVNTDPNGYTCDGERWWGSNYGSTVQDAAGAVDVLAPTILPTTDIGGSGGYVSGDYDMWFNGTSCATPYAAGVCGLILSANPGFTPAQVRDRLCSTAEDVISVESGAGWDRYAGYGMVDAAAAVGGGGPVAPTAQFSAVPLAGSYPLLVSFTDLSSGAPTAWSWDFGDGGSSSLQNPTHTYEAAGTYTVVLTASNAVGSDVETKVDYITVTEPGVTTFVTASGETPVTGTVGGSFLDTVAGDGVVESITEVQYTGHPVKAYSYLEHRWDFSLPAGGNATFHLEAARSDNADGDDMAFEYSIDGVNWTPLVTVTSATEQTFAVDLGTLGGAVTVRAYDTDRSWGNLSLDVLSVDYLAFEVGDVQPTAPTADFAGTPTSGAYPLLVQFTDTSTGDPTSWSWDFGDGGTSTAQSPGHTYEAAGTYTVSLTASNALGSDTLTRTDYITVTEPGGGAAAHVHDIVVSRQKVGPNYRGVAVVTIRDDAAQAVSGAAVSGIFTGPTGGTASGTTGADGTVTLYAGDMKKPSGEWCFEVTDVVHATLPYDAAANVVTKSCEGGDVYAADGRPAVPASFVLEQNYPNPFNPLTRITYRLPAAARVRLDVYNVKGERVATLVDMVQGPGEHSVNWDARDKASGVYFGRLAAGPFRQTLRMILLK